MASTAVRHSQAQALHSLSSWGFTGCLFVSLFGQCNYLGDSDRVTRKIQLVCTTAILVLRTMHHLTPEKQQKLARKYKAVEVVLFSVIGLPISIFSSDFTSKKISSLEAIAAAALGIYQSRCQMTFDQELFSLENEKKGVLSNLLQTCTNKAIGLSALACLSRLQTFSKQWLELCEIIHALKAQGIF